MTLCEVSGPSHKDYTLACLVSDIWLHDKFLPPTKLICILLPLPVNGDIGTKDIKVIELFESENDVSVPVVKL